MTRIALITSNHRRHLWLTRQLCSMGDLVAVIREGKPASQPAAITHPDPVVVGYFQERDERELFWFSDVGVNFSDLKTPVLMIDWGKSNSDEAFQFLIDANPELVFLFGSSIIKDPMLSYFGGYMINMHLGLSPYYRGSATNFWPLADGLPECVGVTLHHATLKVDGGNILLQGRPVPALDDSSHDLGCKSIIVGAELMRKLIKYPALLSSGMLQQDGGKLCRRSDFSTQALMKVLQNFSDGMMEKYIRDKLDRDSQYPIIDFNSGM